MKNYKIQNTNYKGGGTPSLLGITNYKLQITNKLAVKARKETLRTGKNKTIKSKGGHGLPKDSFRLQTMTVFNEKLLRGVQGGGFLEKSPPGRRRQRE